MRGSTVSVLKQVPRREDVTPRQEDVWVNGGIGPRIFNLGARWRSVSHPGCFTPGGKRLPYPLDRGGLVDPRAGLDGGDGREEESLPCCCRELHPGRPTYTLVTILTVVFLLIFIDLEVQVEVILVLTLCSVGNLPQHYTASQPRRPRFESSPP
jgi:hypothetical protein